MKRKKKRVLKPRAHRIANKVMKVKTKYTRKKKHAKGDQEDQK